MKTRMFFVSAALLIEIIIIAIFGQLKIYTSEQKETTADKVIEAVMRNYNLWSEPLSYNGIPVKLGFIDIDFDNEPEFLVTYMQGSGRYSVTFYYDIDTENMKLYEINQYPDNPEISMDIISYGVELYRDNNGECFYLGKDTVRASGDCYYITYQTMNFKDNCIFTTGILSMSEEYGSKRYFKCEQESYSEITAAEYEEEIADFNKKYTNLNLSIQLIENFADAGPSEQREMLLNSYNSFGYDGFICK